MEQINKYSYLVDPGEVVHVDLLPVDVSEHHVEAVLDGRPLILPRGHLSFQFTFPGDKTDSLLLIEAGFISPKPTARYDVIIRGSNKEEQKGPTIDRNNNLVSIRLTRTGPPR